MNITDQEATELVELIIERLDVYGARDVLAGVDESRQQGIEETSWQSRSGSSSTPSSPADLREVGTIRRRPPTSKEMLGFVLERLHQRLIVLPAIVHALHESIASQIVWRVDSEFVSSARKEELEADAGELLPEDLASIQDAYQAVQELIPEFAPARTSDV